MMVLNEIIHVNPLRPVGCNKFLIYLSYYGDDDDWKLNIQPCAPPTELSNLLLVATYFKAQARGKEERIMRVYRGNVVKGQATKGRNRTGGDERLRGLEEDWLATQVSYLFAAN